MTITADIQSLEPGQLWTGYEFDGTPIDAGVLRFHGHLPGKAIWWQGNEYSPWAITAEGFAITTDKPPQPKLRVGNIYQDPVTGVVTHPITTLCKFFDDMVGARIIRRRTLGKFLDAVNFEGGNPTADPDEQLPDEVWFVERKASETLEVVEFELTSAMDFNGVRLPRRQIVANQCGWGYRSPECGYAGGPVAQIDGTPTSDPQLDRCGKRLSDCRLRWGANAALPFGGFPACGMTRL